MEHTLASGVITVTRDGSTDQLPVSDTLVSGKTATATFDATNANPGAYDVVVSGPGVVQPDGANTGTPNYVESCDKCFTVLAFAPDVTSVTPDTTGGNSSRVITVNGTGFTTKTSYCTTGTCSGQPRLTISGDGVTLTPATTRDQLGQDVEIKATPTSITKTVTVASGATPGPRDVVVTNTDGKTDTCTGCFVVGPTPTVSAVNPTQIPEGASNRDVVLTGTNFVQGVTVRVTQVGNDTTDSKITLGTVRRDSGTQLTIPMTVAGDAGTNARRLIVTNPDGGKVETTLLAFSDRPEVSTVTHSEASPTSKYGQGARSRLLTIDGSFFQNGATVSLATPAGITIDRTEFVSTSQIKVTVTLAQAGAANVPSGVHNVTVTNPDGGRSVQTDKNLDVATGPKLESVSPASRGRGEEVTLTLKGSGFSTGGVTVDIRDFEITPGTTVVQDAQTIVVSGKVASALNAAGVKDVSVTNNGDKGQFICTGCFTVDNLQVNTVSPTSVLNDATQTVTLAGSGFATDAAVTLVKTGAGAGSVPNLVSTSATVNQAGTSIAATFPFAGVAPGDYIPRVTNPSTNPGVGTCTCVLAVRAPKPNVISVAPAKLGDGAFNETVVINGTGFAPGAKVAFDNAGISLVGSPVITPTKITAVVNVTLGSYAPPNPADPEQVTVTNTDGQADSTGFELTESPGPTSVSPSARAQSTVTTVQVTGRRFVDGATLLVSGTGITVGTTTFGTNADNPTEQTLTATFTVAGDAPTGARTVYVRNPDGGRASCATCGFNVNAKPVIDSVSPAKGARGTSPLVTIAGTGFNSGSLVTVSGSHVSPTITATTPTSITVTLAVANEAVPGSRDVTVTNTDGGVATKLAAFKVFTVPGAPTRVTGQRGEGKATVSWTAPIDNGNDPLTEYVVTAAPGGATKTVSADQTTATVEGLTNGTAYTFTVVAKNAAGSGPASAPSAPVTPATKPNAPLNVSATPGEGAAVVTWTAPAFDGGSPVTGYTVTSSPGGITKNATGTTAEVTGLANGTEYTFTVVATNAVGDSPASAASTAVRPFTKPDAPTGVTGTPADGAVNLQWTAPAFDGGRPVTGYTITVSPGGATKPVAASSTSAMVDGLTNGTPYTFTVVATNERGASAASAASDAVTPFTKPGAPKTVQATPADGQVTVTWTAPDSNGGNALTGYVVTLSPGNVAKEVGADTLNAVFTGLTNGTAYTATVGATNAAGTTTSEPSAPVTPRTVPGAPTAVQAVRGDQKATVSWTAPGSNGGSPITGYTVTTTPGGTTKQVGPDATSTDVTGLTNGTAYTFTVVATNVAGDGAASAASAPVTPAGVPNAPSSVVATAGTNGTATVSWSEATGNGSPVTDYVITASPGGASKTVTAVSRSTAFSGLTDGTPYTFTVKGINAVGTGAGRSSDPVTPRASTSLSLSATSQIVSGGTTTLRGVLNKVNGTRLVGQQIRVYAKPAGSSSFTLVRYLTTGSDGSYVTTFKPTKNTTYVAVFPGTAGLMPYRSAERVTKVAYKLTATYAQSGRTLTVSGAVSPNVAGRLIYLRHRKADGSLVTIGQAYVQSNGTYKIIRTLAAGTYNTFVFLPATSANAAGQTPFRSVTIR